jgi:hypothetical protein
MGVKSMAMTEGDEPENHAVPTDRLDPHWMSSLRCRVRPAPGGLALVQELLNSAENPWGGADLLCDATVAQSWATSAARAWTKVRGIAYQAPEVSEHDAGQLRQLRERLSGVLAGIPSKSSFHLVANTEFTVFGSNEISWAPATRAWRWFAAAILGEVFLGQQTNTWGRLKRCSNSACTVAFYDRSWDNGEIWHNLTTCAPHARRSHASRPP